jgi:hypothetical protein
LTAESGRRYTIFYRWSYPIPAMDEADGQWRLAMLIDNPNHQPALLPASGAL